MRIKQVQLNQNFSKYYKVQVQITYKSISLKASFSTQTTCYIEPPLSRKPMGACLSDKALTKKDSGNVYTTKPPTKIFTQTSSIIFEVQTWKKEILPDLRNSTSSTRKQTRANQSGRLVYNESTDSINFWLNQKSQKNYMKSQVESKAQLSLSVEKNLKEYIVTFETDFIYELVTSQKQLSEGSKFLFGGTEYKFVKFIHDPKYGQNKVQKISQICDPTIVKTQQYMKSYSNIPVDQEDGKPTCRICLQEQNDKANPLISPCDCIGSVKYYHLKCWSSWIFSSEVSNPGLYIGNVLRQECELCKKNLLQNQLYRQTIAAVLSSVAKIKAPFIVLQGLKPLSNSPYYRSTKLNYIIVSFAQKQKYLIGRGKTVDIPLVIDSSISRQNSFLQMKYGKIYISDAGSKHGTYLTVRQPAIIKDDSPKYFLYKNHLLSMKID